eukprot:3516815-Pyramimonas_sp.AAC.1
MAASIPALRAQSAVRPESDSLVAIAISTTKTSVSSSASACRECMQISGSSSNWPLVHLIGSINSYDSLHTGEQLEPLAVPTHEELSITSH